MATSRFIAPNIGRERLAPPALVVGLALGIVLTLALLFNPASFLQRIQHSHAPAVDLYFVKAAARDARGDAIMLLLARREIEANHDLTALRVLAPLMPRAARRTSGQRLRPLDYGDRPGVRYAYLQGSTWHASQQHALRVLVSQLRKGAEGRVRHEPVAEAAVADDLGAARGVRGGLAREDRARWAGIYALVANAAEGLDHPRDAARFDFAAERYASTRAAKTRYFLAALQVLQRHNDVAMAVAEGRRHLAGLAREPIVLRRMIVLARAANEPQTASRYAKRLLGMT